MKKFFEIMGAALVLALVSCTPQSAQSGKGGQEAPAATFFKGADISWITEMESRGLKFYDSSAKEQECTALLHGIGFNAVRYRVWVNPSDGWCSKEDVLDKAKRAKALGMKILIDFHYADSWADPGKQPVPSAWKGQTPEQMAGSVAQHTASVLKYLKDNGIDVEWVQVGNEVDNGMLWESGRVQGSDAVNFSKYFNAGASAVRQVYPSAKVILHMSNAWNADALKWFFDLMRAGNVSYDMIGLSLYPSYWAGGGYPDWKPKTVKAVENFAMLHDTYGKPVMLVEFGMPASQPSQSRDCLQYLLDNTKSFSWFKGIFLWEPESEKSRNGYEYGAFSDGKPTTALDPFRK